MMMPLRPGQLRGGRFTGFHVGIHAQIANLPRDEMAVLAARVEDGDLWCVQKTVAGC